MAPAEQPRIVTGRWDLDGVAAPPDASVVGTPVRRAGSLRRTSHLDVSWPGGYGSPMHLFGRARDLVTSSAGAPSVRAQDEVQLDIAESREIASVTVRPHRDGAERLVGASAVRGLRAVLDAAVPGERALASPLMFLLDDLPVVSMISGIAWAQQRPLEIPMDAPPSGGTRAFQRTASGAIACSGLRPGGYYEQSLDQRITFPHWVRLAGDLGGPDALAWHEIDPAPEVCFRRRRRLDAWSTGEVIDVDAHFRDSVWGPRHDEIALHEYTLTATIDAASLAVLSINVASRVLPFPECPAAASNVGKIVGADVRGLRAGVHTVLGGVECCTHLNEMLRGLSEVPTLVRSIDT